jgi:hypothetical protein
MSVAGPDRGEHAPRQLSELDLFESGVLGAAPMGMAPLPGKPSIVTAAPSTVTHYYHVLICLGSEGG